MVSSPGLFGEPAEPTKRLSADEIYRRLSKRYPEQEYALFREVPNATGGGRRRCDALAVGLWQSRGHYITGFEFKSSRPDWVSELKRPEKADDVAKHCHYWNLVVGNAAIVREDELPATWGLLVPTKDGLRMVVKPTLMTPLPITLSFFASLCRCQQYKKPMRPQQLSTQDPEAYQKGYDAAKVPLERTINELRNQLQLRMDIIDGLKKSTGLMLSGIYSEKQVKRIAQLVNYFADHGPNRLQYLFDRLKETAKQLDNTADGALLAIKEMDEELGNANQRSLQG